MVEKSLKNSQKRFVKKESKIASDIKKLFMSRGWEVMNTHGNQYQKGFPDAYCIHPLYRQRWVEYKRPKVGRYTKDQLKCFPVFEKCGIGVWVMTEASEEQYKAVIVGKPNWRDFLKGKDWDVIKKRYSWFEK